MTRFNKMVYSFIAGLCLPLPGHTAEVCTVDPYVLPADIPLPNSSATASTFRELLLKRQALDPLTEIG